MKFRRHQTPPDDPEAPAGVILHYRGRAIGCDVLRDEGQDRGPVAAWIAVPSEPVTIMPGEEVQVTATVLPARTTLIFDFGTLPGPGGGDEWWVPGA